jgi:pyruvate kinase
MVKKQTKIVATVSDLKCDVDFLSSLYRAGVNVFRLNTAHQSPADSLRVVKNIRRVSPRAAILIDTKGPEIRTTKVEEDIVVKKGQIFKFQGTSKGTLSTRDLVFVTYKNFVRDLKKGDQILLDDGKTEFEVIKKEKDILKVKALNNGEIKSRKSVNVPGVEIKLPSLTKKDKEYIDFCIKHDIDFIAHSFVRNKADVLAIQKILDKNKSDVKIISKIENREGVEKLDEILDHSYGVMVARGDLGIEIPAEEVPFIQKEMIARCIERQKPVITATQMLHSMIKNARPTRAEVSDVANAIFDGTDAVMLSEETARGDHPLEAVRVMTRIAQEVESKKEFQAGGKVFEHEFGQVVSYLAKYAVEASEDLDIKEIIVSSANSYIAEVIASYRGITPVFVKCSTKKRMRELSLTYGVTAHYVGQKNGLELLKQVFQELITKKKLTKDDNIIYLSTDNKKNNNANLMEICEVGKYI